MEQHSSSSSSSSSFNPNPAANPNTHSAQGPTEATAYTSTSAASASSSPMAAQLGHALVRQSQQALQTQSAYQQSQVAWQHLLEEPTPRLAERVLGLLPQATAHLSPSQVSLRKTWAQWVAQHIGPIEGLGACQMALELDPQASEAWTLLAQFQRACCLKEVGYQSLLQAIKLQPLKNPVARKLLLQWLNEDRSDARINQSQLGHWLFKLEHKVLYQVGKTFSSPTPKVEDTALLAPLPTVASEPNEAAPPTLAAYDDLPQAPMPPVLPPIQGAAADNSSLPTVASPEEQQQALKHILALEVQWSQQGDNTDLALELAETCLQHQAYVKALYYVRTAINQAPNHAKAYTLMAKVVHAMGDKEGCTEAYRSAIAFAEDNLWAATTAAQLGQYYWQELADSEQAITCYHMAQELDPDELEHPFALAELYCDLNRLADACTIYEQLRERQSDNAELHCFLGYLYWSLQRCEEAAEAYQTCLQLEPNNPIACNNLGVFYLDETQELPKALGYFERALRLKPSYTMAHFNQGRTLEALNHKSEALAAFEKALRCNVQEPEVEEAKLRERITQLKQA